MLSGASGQLTDPLAGAGILVGEADNDDFLGSGVCGIAVADLPTTPPIAKTILVATLNGELVVFQQTNGVVNPNPLFRTVVAGGIGAFNSIVVADLEPDPASKPEVYIAGSSGLRRFDFP